jgi:hypothetical protein
MVGNIRDIIVDTEGLSSKIEYKVFTPGGDKQYRFIDIVALDVNRSPVAFYQVGQVLKSGIPLSRERKAILDILDYSGIKIPLFFIPYTN